MRNILLAFIISMFVLPAYSAEVEVPKAQSVKYFTQQQDARFRYDLPEGKGFSMFNKKDSKSSAAEDDNSEVTLREEDVKPVKKIIKKLDSTSSAADTQTLDKENTPMNYDSFPKFYDANDMMQQQFMPMPTATF